MYNYKVDYDKMPKRKYFDKIPTKWLIECLKENV